MNPSNKEMQLQRTCQIYAYVLRSQGKEAPEEVLDCAVSYDYLLDCTKDLAKELESLDSETFDKIANNKNSQNARNLVYWWEMYQEADRLRRSLFSDT